MKKLSLVILLGAALTALSFSQGQGRGFGGGFQMNPKLVQYGLLNFDDVKTELKLTDDQKTKLGAAQDDMRTNMRQAFQDAQGDQAAIQTAMKKATDTLTTTIEGVLTDDQKKRLRELYIQRQGGSAIADPDVQKELKLTDDQVKQVKDLQDKGQAANQSLMEKARNGELDRSEIGPLVQKNNETLKAGLEKILTDGQRDQLKKMGGTPFTFDPKDSQMGFGRRPGGGGGGGN